VQTTRQRALHLRAEILYSATFTTDANGAKLETPVDLLLASTYEGGGPIHECIGPCFWEGGGSAQRGNTERYCLPFRQIAVACTGIGAGP
jgi:hypothetical protein